MTDRINTIIDIARSKPRPEAAAMISKLIGHQIGWITTQDGRRIPLTIANG